LTLTCVAVFTRLGRKTYLPIMRPAGAYVFKPPRPLAEIDAKLKGVTDRILTMIGVLSA